MRSRTAAPCPESLTRYSDLLADWLVELGYTHCFFVAGGNIMHLLDAVRVRMTCVPVVHEVAAGIAAEYFNEAAGTGKAFALVTAGPGITNIVTALGGAWLESRELLVLGGQVKSTDLATGGIRQRGIQEVDGVAIVTPICVRAVRIESPLAGTRSKRTSPRERPDARGLCSSRFAWMRKALPSIARRSTSDTSQQAGRYGRRSRSRDPPRPTSRASCDDRSAPSCSWVAACRVRRRRA